MPQNSPFHNHFNRFKRNKRAFYSLIILGFIFLLTFFAEIIANDKPILVFYQKKIYFPIFKEIPETEFGGVFDTAADYRDKQVQKLIKQDGFMIWPLYRYSYDTINFDIKTPSPAKPSSDNWLGTDDNGRDVLARVIYGIRISLVFGILLTFFSTIIAIILGAIQGYFGGLIDIIFQRFLEIWSAMPVLFLLIILSSIIEPSFLMLLSLMLLFSWMSLVSYVRAEFLRIKNFDYVLAAKSIGGSNLRIIFKHILPNSMPVIVATIPFLLSGSIITLTSLDFLGLGMPVGSPSLGELLAQGKNNINAPWLGITGFLVISILLTMLIFIGEGARDAFDYRK